MNSSSNKLIVLAIYLCYVINHCHGFNPFAKTVVTITNNISPQAVLRVSCKSKDDDLGEHVLSSGQRFQWKFRPSVFRVTLFFCRFAWNNQVKRFDVYTPSRDQGHCITCNWSIMADRLCLSGNLDKYYDRCYQWK
ncbi:hypothetical protein CARUB_v10022377mg [Capsella rubella]|uniref:S-protein homolog n=1 Tax=Capsella rubella TaxID=81985 RepID=R0I9K3_9BRAS|nr:hypothetical protein CARUB_v10022377mg [Capsella rubella]